MPSKGKTRKILRTVTLLTMMFFGIMTSSTVNAAAEATVGISGTNVPPNLKMGELPKLDPFSNPTYSLENQLLQKALEDEKALQREEQLRLEKEKQEQEKIKKEEEKKAKKEKEKAEKKKKEKAKKKKAKKEKGEIFVVTAYCPCYECSEGWGRKTSTGAYAESDHTIAVDPDVIPYGTTVIINGNEYVAEDCGGGVNGEHIDMFFDTHEETEEWGVKHLEVIIKK